MKGKKKDTAPKFPSHREEFAGELTPDCSGGPVSAKHTDRFRKRGTDPQTGEPSAGAKPTKR